jgi:hypothetical protein
VEIEIESTTPVPAFREKMSAELKEAWAQRKANLALSLLQKVE